MTKKKHLLPPLGGLTLQLTRDTRQFSANVYFTIIRAAARDSGTAPIASPAATFSSLHKRQCGSARRQHSIALDKQALPDQFKTLTNEILEERSKRFTEQNQTNLGALPDPLKVRIIELPAETEDTASALTIPSRLPLPTSRS
jgi:DNA anti-recombination protein RmuC